FIGVSDLAAHRQRLRILLVEPPAKVVRTASADNQDSRSGGRESAGVQFLGRRSGRSLLRTPVRSYEFRGDADEGRRNRVIEALERNALDHLAALDFFAEPAELAALDELRRLLRAGHIEPANVIGEFNAVLQDHFLNP